MIGLDTNLLLYARLEGIPFYKKGRAFLEELNNNTEVVIAELVLVESMWHFAIRRSWIRF